MNQEKILKTVGTLQLIDTGHRCATRGVRILRVHCAKNCGADELMHDAIITPYWEIVLMFDGYHQGCDPNSTWAKDPVGSLLRRNATRSLIDQSPVGACVACGEIECTGARVPRNQEN